MSEMSARVWLTTQEVADLFGVTARTVCRWIDDGMLPGYRLPGQRGDRRVRRAKLAEFARQRPQYGFILEKLDHDDGTGSNGRSEAE